MKNTQNLNAYKKAYINFCRQTPLSSQQTVVVLPQIVFYSFFQKILLFLKSFFNNKISGT